MELPSNQIDEMAIYTHAHYQTWLGGYQVIIAQVLRTYGDGALSGGLTLPNPAAAG